MLSALQPFILGGIAGCVGTTFVQPVDLIKVRLQLLGESSGVRKGFLDVIKDIHHETGIRGFWKGLSAGYARQLLYGSTRLGLFRVLADKAKELNDNKPISLATRVLCGMSSGAVAALVGNPADLALVRMQADSTLPPAQRRHYRNVFDAFTRIIKDEGLFALWRGCVPTVIRAIFMNAAMMSMNDQSKEWLVHFKAFQGEEKRTQLSLASAAIGGVAGAVASLPADLVKTRLQKMVPDANGKLPYKGFFDCALQIARKEGLGAFYVGIGTYVARIGPHGFIALFTLDMLTLAVNKWKKKRLQE